MQVNDTVSKSSGALQNWLILLSLIFASFSGVVLALICIYSLPDKTTQPLTGSAFFIGSVLIMAFLLLLWWKKEKSVETEVLRDAAGSSPQKIVVKESISEKILKWIVTIFSLFFIFDGLTMGMICIYALPDKTVQPKVGAIYFLGGAMVLATFVYVVWKNWISDQP